MHYITLTDEQIKEIQSKYPNFDNEEVAFEATYHVEDDSFDHAFGTEKCYSHCIDNVDIIIENELHELIIHGDNVEDSIITLSDSQCDEILEMFS